ncbi:7,8-dihydroneopterin aldolase [Bacteroidales bacterium]|nr:7,8-dihydroneopterin aldolase [Bacteroidales bacterium]
MQTYIELREMKFHAFHGVFPQENIVGNIYIVNLKLFVDLQPASISDNLEDTVSYADIYQCVKKEMQIPSKLIECVAGRIFRKIKSEFPTINKLEVRLSKLNPPMGGEVQAACVVFTEA